jgi:hypothetical protein
VGLPIEKLVGELTSLATGALLDAVSEGLQRLPDVRLERLPRMADFAR